MEKEAYRHHFDLEESHWWFLGRKKAIRSLLEKVIFEKDRSVKAPVSILDVGCGTGGMLQFFKNFGKVWGIDLSPEALRYCLMRRGSAQLVQGTVLNLPFPNEQFDLVVSCNLLYHRWVTDDVAALCEFHRVCKREGYLLITDSAFECLRSTHDDFFHGKRRYTLKELKSKVEKSGFLIKRISYMNMASFPPIYLWRRVLSHSKESDLKPIAPSLNRCLSWLLCKEAQLLRYGNLPFGTSVICLSQKA